MCHVKCPSITSRAGPLMTPLFITSNAASRSFHIRAVLTRTTPSHKDRPMKSREVLALVISWITRPHPDNTAITRSRYSSAVLAHGDIITTLSTYAAPATDVGEDKTIPGFRSCITRSFSTTCSTARSTTDWQKCSAQDHPMGRTVR